MPRIALSNTGRTPMEKLMGHAPHILDPWTKLEDAFFASKTFSPALLEQVRRRTAHLLQKRRRESLARKEGILEFRPRVEDVRRMAHEFFHGCPTGVRKCNAWHSRSLLLVRRRAGKNVVCP